MPGARDNNLVEKEFLLIQELARQPTATQRDLSQRLELSLGMTNLLIQRLARKGLIKVTQLDWKRTQYLLTFKGAMEKTRKACSYAVYTLRIFKQIKENITTALGKEHAAGRREFVLVAQDEILDIARETIADLGFEDARFTFLSRFEDVPAECDLVLVAASQEPDEKRPGRRYIALVDFDNIDFRL